MRDSDEFLAAVRRMNYEGKLVAAICAAPIALDRAGLLEGKHYTCYPSTAQKIQADAEWVDELAVQDGTFIPGISVPLVAGLLRL